MARALGYLATLALLLIGALLVALAAYGWRFLPPPPEELPALATASAQEALWADLGGSGAPRFATWPAGPRLATLAARRVFPPPRPLPNYQHHLSLLIGALWVSANWQPEDALSADLQAPKQAHEPTSPRS